jgi:hypothetical protein
VKKQVLNGRGGNARLTEDFRARLDDRQASIAEDLVDAGAPLLVAFAGFAGGLGIRPSEFFDLTADITANRIFMRDVRKLWYQKGVAGVAEDLDGVTAYIAGKKEELKPSRLLLVGNSAGGYAAIVAAILLGDGRAIAFAPQTFLDRGHRFLHRDRRCHDLFLEVHRTPGKRYTDIKPLLRERSPSCEIDIYYSTLDRLDKVHAERLSFSPSVRTHPVGEGGHGIIKHMARTGELAAMVRDAL